MLNDVRCAMLSELGVMLCMLFCTLLCKLFCVLPCILPCILEEVGWAPFTKC